VGWWFQTPYFSAQIFQKTLQYTSGLFNSTSFGAQISKTFCSHVNLDRKKWSAYGGWLPLDLSTYTKYERNSNGYHPVFGCKESNGTIGNTVRRNWKSEIQDGGLLFGNTYISNCWYDCKKILTAIPIFSGSSNPKRLLDILCDLTRSQNRLGIRRINLLIMQFRRMWVRL